MRGFNAWRALRTYRKLPDAWREVVFYGETGQDWHHFEPLIAELTGRLQRKVTYVSSDPLDPGLEFAHSNFTALCITEGLFLTVFFQMQQAGVMVLTVMDLDNLHLKRSINPVHYVYLFHGMGSTHMVDHANSYDAYDSLFCVGPHQVAELRKREELAGLPARNLFPYGHPRLEQLVSEGRAWAETTPANGKTVLVAPTWGDDAIFNRCGRDLIGTLLAAGFRVIMRPHYHTRRLTPDVLDGLVAEFGEHPRFEKVEQMDEKDSLFRSDILVSDWSAMAVEYALGLEKPVLFIDLPRRIRNPDWQQWEIEPIESSIREQVGAILAPDRLADAPALIDRLLQDRDDLEERMRQLRSATVFNLGHCIALGADEIDRLAGLHKPREAARGR